MDAATWASLATAVGTLVLAVVTFSSVRSANRSARIAEQNMLANLRPLLLTSRMQDAEQKVGFIDQHWVRVGGNRATAEVDGDVIYLTASLRNAGNGLALLHGWHVVREERGQLESDEPAPLEQFRRLTRDLYIAGGDIGFWQGAIRDAADPDFDYLRDAIKGGDRITIDLLYGDQEGRQRVISRITMSSFNDASAWLGATARHYYPDRPNPR